MNNTTHNISEAVQSYFAALLGYMTTVDLMQLGATVLLVARLIVDLPPAYRAVKEFLSRKK